MKPTAAMSPLVNRDRTWIAGLTSVRVVGSFAMEGLAPAYEYGCGAMLQCIMRGSEEAYPPTPDSYQRYIPATFYGLAQPSVTAIDKPATRPNQYAIAIAAAAGQAGRFTSLVRSSWAPNIAAPARLKGRRTITA